MLLTAGCQSQGPSDPVGAPSALTVALGGCLANGDEVDAELGLLSARLLEYDPHGVLVRSRADFFDDDRFYDWDIVYTYGASHQLTREQGVYPTIDSGWTYDYTWWDGNIVHQSFDSNADGAPEEVGEFIFYRDQIVHWEWDYDGDETFDDHADFVWSPDGTGWSVIGDGEDPNGPYRTEEWRDEYLRQVDYTYGDATGLEVEWHVESYSILGVPGSVTSTFRQDGTITAEERDLRVFDRLGRLVGRSVEESEFDGGSLVASTMRTITYTWICP